MPVAFLPMNLTLALSRSINANLDSLFSRSPRYGIKARKLLRSQAARWLALPVITRVEQIGVIWEGQSEEEFNKTYSNLYSWAAVAVEGNKRK
jgi:hypothetical protein